ncbi:MAG: hypothetical protein HYY18_11405 [Planctomycetes bacterium]|nr:hypothetical protein [Planctomycetota bacterium]
METRFETTGEHAEWDSDKKKSSGLNGFKRFEALVGHKFTATVEADGSWRELKGGDWPAAAKPGKAGAERDERAAAATHDPTPAGVWMNLLFDCTPAAKEVDTKKIRLLDEEPIHFHADGTETVGKYACVKSRMHSTDREHAVAPAKLNARDGSDAGAIGLALARETRKRGNAWFSRKAGCLVKTEFQAGSEITWGKQSIHADYKWRVELKDRGFTTVKPPVTTEDPPAPTPTK